MVVPNLVHIVVGLEGARGIEKSNNSFENPKIQDPSKCWEETIVCSVSTQTKMTALARCIDPQGGWTDVD